MASKCREEQNPRNQEQPPAQERVFGVSPPEYSLERKPRQPRCQEQKEKPVCVPAEQRDFQRNIDTTPSATKILERTILAAVGEAQSENQEAREKDPYGAQNERYDAAVFCDSVWSRQGKLGFRRIRARKHINRHSIQAISQPSVRFLIES